MSKNEHLFLTTLYGEAPRMTSIQIGDNVQLRNGEVWTIAERGTCDHGACWKLTQEERTKYLVVHATGFYETGGVPSQYDIARIIARSKKPSYTEAVKKSGWSRWPFNSDWDYAAWTPAGQFRGFNRRPTASVLNPTTGWYGYPLITDDILNPNLCPPRFEDKYKWQETLLYRKDFY